MKKLIMCLVALLILVGCKVQEKNIDLNKLIEDVTKDLEIPKYDVVNLSNSSDFDRNVFVEYSDGYQAIMADSIISSVPHSLIILRVDEKDNVEQIAKEMFDNANARKWLCTFAEEVGVIYADNTIVLVMSFKDVVEGVLSNFKSVYSNASEGWVKNTLEDLINSNPDWMNSENQ